MKKSHVIGLLIILAFGAARLNFEQKLTEENRASFYHGAILDFSLRQQIGQEGYLAALGGFRAPVADFLWIEGHVAWGQKEWPRMVVLFRSVTTLQPRNVTFWDISAWHMGWNASLDAYNDKIHQPDLAIREENQQLYFKAAERIYLDGIRNNPDSFYLCEQLGNLYRDKFKDYLKAYEYYNKAAQFHDAPIYEKRMAAYQLAKVPGREREAYDLLLKYYNMGKNEHLTTLLTSLQDMENKLDIPASERVQFGPDELQELKILKDRLNIHPVEGVHSPNEKR